MSKEDLGGSTYIVLKDGEFAGWFNIPTGTEQTFILRAALSSDPTIIDLEDLTLDLKDLPDPASGYFWDGQTFIKKD